MRPFSLRTLAGVALLGFSAAACNGDKSTGPGGTIGLSANDRNSIAARFDAEANRLNGIDGGNNLEVLALRTSAQAVRYGAGVGSASANGVTYRLVATIDPNFDPGGTLYTIAGLSEQGDFVWGISELPAAQSGTSRLGSSTDVNADGEGGLSSSATGAYWTTTSGLLQVSQNADVTSDCDPNALSLNGAYSSCRLGNYTGTLQLTGTTTGGSSFGSAGPTVNLTNVTMGGATLVKR